MRARRFWAYHGEEFVSQGFDLKMVTGAASGNTHRYAAVWRK